MATAQARAQAYREAHHGLLEHKKEIAWSLALVSAVLAAVGVLYIADPGGLSDARDWATLPWAEVPCAVEDVGIAYRGTCDLNVDLKFVRGYDEFSECTTERERVPSGESEDMLRWQQTPAGRCAARGDYAYQNARSERRLTDPGVPPHGSRRLQTERLRFNCQNSYLPWAQVRLTNSSGDQEFRCAYQFGASEASLTDDWDMLQKMLKHLRQENIKLKRLARCWQLVFDNCVVSLSDLQALLEKQQRNIQKLGNMSMICGSIMALCSMLACCWHCEQQSAIVKYQSLPTQDLGADEQATPSDRVNALMAAASVHLFEDTPPASTRAGGDARAVDVAAATGETAKVPRNIAADFVR